MFDLKSGCKLYQEESTEMGNRILVVDDEKEIADVIELYLKNEGFEVEKFYTGKDAIASIEKAAPDMALLDVMLPDIDGFEILQRSSPRNSDVSQHRMQRT